MEAMGTDDRLPAARLIARLRAHPQGFDLFQAINLLERATPWANPPGHGDGAREAIRLKGHVSLAFEASDVRRVRERGTSAHARGERIDDTDSESIGGREGKPEYVLSTPAMTLAGAGGPLPLPFTEMVLAHRAARDEASADLLDILNHRFLSFLYRSRKKHTPALNWRSPLASPLAACLDALGNLGLDAQGQGQGEAGGSGRAQLWLRHAGLFSAAPRSMSGLLAVLGDRLGLRVTGESFVGRWREVEAQDALRLTGSTRSGQAPRLGRACVLGRRAWDQHAGIRMAFFDVPPERFAALLPGGEAHALAVWLVRRHAQQDLDVEFVLHAAPRRAACTLGGHEAARLGWTSWLGGAARASQPAPVRFNARAAGGAAHA
ncbi:type VI secretion system baseplate subunit TssG [Paraburkholderia unamae]|uniref:Type VI secretion system protein ImpH n=1 Tax=Paraburkholderia unamae TaxID=219649 RepID=A0ABX5KV50_9BURK|nr:type VI secretion system baseplate subunit TssG [Paraburkholderia unamae]PVX85173.1 type VI secretion system protein ImpH [Paraburkholderia unamae]